MIQAIGRGAVAVGAGVARMALATARFAGRATMQAAERIIPHGANELGSALYTGSAYAPPGVTERLTQNQGNVHGTGPQQQAHGNVHGTGSVQVSQTQHATTVSPPRQQPVASPTPTHQQALQQASERASSRPQERGLAR